jgi:DNA-binding MarR family transcriptional regulator
METLQKLSELRDLKGPSPAFTKVQLAYALMVVGGAEGVGRKRLAQLLGLGEGTVRTMVSRLASAGLIHTTRKGLSLTERGRQLYQSLTSIIGSVGRASFPLPWDLKHSIGVLVRGLADRVLSGLEERDEAIRYGADAAIVLTREADGIHMPQVSNISRERPEFAKNVEEFFKPSVGDVMIIAGAQEERKALYAALAAALKLYEKAKKP